MAAITSVEDAESDDFNVRLVVLFVEEPPLIENS